MSSNEFVAVLRYGPLHGEVRTFKHVAQPFLEFYLTKGGGEKWYFLFLLVGEDSHGRKIYECHEAIDEKTDDGMTVGASMWNYLHPGERVYKGPTDNHPQTTISAYPRQASVDTGIADLILAVWRHGWHTVGSCQEWAEGTKHAGEAYISFALPRQGKAFAEVLNNAGLKFRTINLESTHNKKNDAGDVIRTATTISLAVLFSPANIPTITNLLQLPGGFHPPLPTPEIWGTDTASY